MSLPPTFNDTAMRLKEVIACVGLSRSTVYNKLNPKSGQYDPEFPKPFRIGAKAIAWSRVQIQEWLNSKKGALTY